MVYSLSSVEESINPPRVVTLKATTVSGDVIYKNIKVRYAYTQQFTIYHLAAKAAILDLEAGQRWKYSGASSEELLSDAEIEEEAERIGLKWSIAGKWTSFVAVSQSSEDRIAGFFQAGGLVTDNLTGSPAASESASLRSVTSAASGICVPRAPRRVRDRNEGSERIEHKKELVNLASGYDRLAATREIERLKATKELERLKARREYEKLEATREYERLRERKDHERLGVRGSSVNQGRRRGRSRSRSRRGRSRSWSSDYDEQEYNRWRAGEIGQKRRIYIDRGWRHREIRNLPPNMIDVTSSPAGYHVGGDQRAFSASWIHRLAAPDLEFLLGLLLFIIFENTTPLTLICCLAFCYILYGRRRAELR